MKSGTKRRATRTIHILVQAFVVAMIAFNPAVQAGNICADPAFAAAMGITCKSYKPPTAAPKTITTSSSTKTTTTSISTTTPSTTTTTSTPTTTTTPAPTTQPETTLVPTTEPETTPIPTTEPETTPIPTTEPETTPIPTTLPETTPVSMTEPETTPVPTTQPETTPIPTTEPETTPIPTTEPETTPIPTTEPETTPIPKTLPETTPVSMTEPETTPTTQPETTPITTTEPETIPIPTTEPETTPIPTREPETTPIPTTLPETTPVSMTEPETTPIPTTQPGTTPIPPIQPETTPISTTQPETTPIPTTEPETTPIPTTEPETTPTPTTLHETIPDSMTEPETTPVPTTQPETTPIPLTEPETTPILTTEPETAPIPTTEPETTTIPTMEPETTPIPTTEPETTPAPTTEPETTPIPTTEPETAPIPTTEPETTTIPTTEPETTPIPTTEPETTPVPTTEPETTPIPTTKPETTTTTTPLPSTTPCIMSSMQWDLCQSLLVPCPTDSPNTAFPSRNVSRCLANQTKIQTDLTSSGIDCQTCVTTTAFAPTTTTPESTTTTSTTTITTALPGTTCTPLTSEQVVNCYFLLVDFSLCPASQDEWRDQWEYCFFQTTLVPDTAGVCRCLQAASIEAGDAAFGSPPKLSEITTTGPFTYCYYTKFRPAQLTQRATFRSLWSRGAVAKRLAFSSDIGVDCQYPGIVTLFKDAGLSSQEVQGSGILLDHDTILVTGYVLQNIELIYDNNYGELAVHVSTYDLTSLDTATTVTAIANTMQLDSEGMLYAVKLTTPLNFDTACILPACVPRNALDLADLDLNDCRVVASGAFDNGEDFWTNYYKTSIQEVRVRVDPEGLNSSAKINVNRIDSNPTIACANDAGGSLICPTLSTREWITLGLVEPFTFPCQTGVELSEISFFSLLAGGTAYNTLQSYPYTTP